MASLVKKILAKGKAKVGGSSKKRHAPPPSSPSVEMNTEEFNAELYQDYEQEEETGFSPPRHSYSGGTPSPSPMSSMRPPRVPRRQSFSGVRPTPTPTLDLSDSDSDSDSDDEGDGENEPSTKSNRKESYVWKYMKKSKKTKVIGEDRYYKVTCRICKKARKQYPGAPLTTYNHKVSSGTGTIARHLKEKHGITAAGVAGSSGGTQTQLHGYAQQLPGGGMPFSYDRDRMIAEFANYVISDELPFNHGESNNFEYFARVALQPQFRRVPRNTLKRHSIKAFKAARLNLMQYFHDFNGRVSLTSDTWSSSVGEPFMCVTAHWLDYDYILQKRIIAFEVMQESHTGFNIKTRLVDVCRSYHLLDKVFSISLDNASANTKAIDYIREDRDFTLILGGQFIHVRCCAHIINLSVQEGLSCMQRLLDPIRSIIKTLRRGGAIRRRYFALCRQHNLPKKCWSLDSPTRWNSTFHLLRDALRYREVLTTMHNEKVTDPLDMITDYHWHVATLICEVLEGYDEATNIFSYVYEPNVHLVIMQCVNVMNRIHKNVDIPDITLVLESMRTKWKEYLTDFPYIYGIATILDPGVKIDGLRQLLNYYYKCLSIDFEVERYITTCRLLLEQLFDQYSALYNPSYVASGSQSQPDRFGNFLDTIIRSQKANALGGIDDYLSYQFEIGRCFDVLKWWKLKSTDYPILSRIAKDIFAIPASTIASESAFSAGRRVLDEKRSRLSPESIEMCVCKKDWDQAERRTQGLKEDAGDEDDEWLQVDTDSTNPHVSNDEEDSPE